MHFLANLLSYGFEITLGESSGIKAMSFWFASKLSKTQFSEVHKLTNSAVCIRQNTMNSKEVQLSEHLKYKYLISM